MSFLSCDKKRIKINAYFFVEVIRIPNGGYLFDIRKEVRSFRFRLFDKFQDELTFAWALKKHARPPPIDFSGLEIIRPVIYLILQAIQAEKAFPSFTLDSSVNVNGVKFPREIRSWKDMGIEIESANQARRVEQKILSIGERTLFAETSVKKNPLDIKHVKHAGRESSFPSVKIDQIS